MKQLDLNLLRIFLVLLETKNLSQKRFIPNNEGTSKTQHGLIVFFSQRRADINFEHFSI